MDACETEFYSGHIGLDMDCQLAGWNTAGYLELGYFNPSQGVDSRSLSGFGSGSGNSMGGGMAAAGTVLSNQCVDIDLELMPLTLNYKLERNLTKNLNVKIFRVPSCRSDGAPFWVGPFSTPDEIDGAECGKLGMRMDPV